MMTTEPAVFLLMARQSPWAGLEEQIPFHSIYLVHEYVYRNTQRCDHIISSLHAVEYALFRIRI